MTETGKTAVIGAGASGLAAAVVLARQGIAVTVFEHKPEPGRKILLTGHGKCNLTNAYMSPECYYSEPEGRIAEYLKRFSTNQAIVFFDSLGVEVYEKNGFYYPASNDANTVLDALYNKALELNVSFIFNCGDLNIDELRDRFNSVILACGSSACKKTGSNGSGYRFLQKLGIRYSRILPALCPLYVDSNEFCIRNAGKRIIAAVSVYSDVRLLAEDTGEVQIQNDRLSGIPVLQISRFVTEELDKGNNCSLILDLNPEMKKIPVFIRSRFSGGVEKKEYFSVSKMPRFDNAQVCRGGVSLDELTEDFELKKAPGVYVIGEMCDVDGKCGGYNLHWAWLSANLCCK